MTWVLMAGACAFDTQVPPDAVIRCEGAGDCPSGWRCSPLRRVCVPAAQSDTASPALGGGVAPSRVRPGGLVAVRVTTDEPLASPPEFELLLGAQNIRLDGGAEPTPDGGYDFFFPAPLVVDEQPLTVFARAEDRLANLTPRALIGSVLVDGQPPSLVSASLTPGLVAPGVPVFASLLFSEPVSSAVLRIEGTETVLRVEPPSTSLQHVFVPGDGGSRTVGLEVLRAEDTVGNVGGAADAGLVRVDAEGPTVFPLALDAGRYSAQPGFDRLVVPLRVAGATSVTVCVEGLTAPPDAGAGPCVTHGAGAATSEWTVVDPGNGGTAPRLVLVAAVDEVGNRSQGSTTVIFDFDAPRLLDSTVAFQAPPDCPVARPQAVGLDGGVDVRLSVDEPLGAPPLLQATGLDFSPATSSAALLWSARGQLSPGAVAGAVTPRVRLVDEVGNEAERMLTEALRLDPAPPATFGPNSRLRYRRAPWGDRLRPGRFFELEGPPGTFSPGSMVRVIGRVNGQDFILSQASADADGGLPPTELFPIDFNTLSVIEFDDACNRGPAQQVPFVEWVVSLNGKTPGGTVPNPHRFLSLEASLATSLLEPGAREWGEAELAASDGRRAVLQGGGARWYRVGGPVPPGPCLAPSPRGAEVFTLDVSGGEAAPRRAVLDLDRRAWLFDAVPATLIPDGPCASRGDGVTYAQVGLRVARFDGAQWTMSASALPGNAPPQALGVDPVSGQPLAVRTTAVGDGGVTFLFRLGSDGGWLPERVGDAGFLYGLAVSSLGGAVVVTGCAAPDCSGPRQTWLRDGSGWRPAENPFSATIAGIVCEDAVAPGLFVLGADAGFRLGDAGWVATVPPFGVAPAFCVVAPRDGGAVTLAITATGDVAAWDGTTWSPLALAAGARGEAAGAPLRQALTHEPTGAPLWLASADGGPASSWAWRGGAWALTTPQAPDLGPASAAWNAGLGQVMVVGIDGGATTTGGPWASVANSPSGRTGLALGTFGASFVAFGGASKTNNLNDTWVWSGTWRRLRDGGVSDPAPRAFAALAEVPGLGLVLHGGEAMEEFVVEPAFPSARGAGVGVGALVVDVGAPTNDVATPPGGGNVTRLSDTWAWNGLAWAQLRLQGSPGARSRGSLVWDDVNGRLVLVGGVERRDTWWLDPAEATRTWRDWTALVGSVPANGRAVFSPDDDAVLLNSASGTFLLLPEGVPAHRLVPSASTANLPADAQLLSLEVELETGEAHLVQLWDGQRWVTTAGPFGPEEARRFLQAGLQVVPVRGRRLSTDFAQVVVRYRP
jgi:hypothetical protein